MYLSYHHHFFVNKGADTTTDASTTTDMASVTQEEDATDEEGKEEGGEEAGSGVQEGEKEEETEEDGAWHLTRDPLEEDDFGDEYLKLDEEVRRSIGHQFQVEQDLRLSRAIRLDMMKSCTFKGMDCKDSR